MQTEQILFALIRAQIAKKPVDPAVCNLTQEQITAVYDLARNHDLSHFVGQALSEAGVLGQDRISDDLRQMTVKAIGRYVRKMHEFECTCRVLEDAGIKHIPLKGFVLLQYYPEPWMRTSCDVDILIHEEDMERAITVLSEKLGYADKGRSYHDVSLFSQSGVHIELHFDTIEEGVANDDCRSVLAGVWEHAKSSDGMKYRMCMTDEMFYFYHIAHMAKHFTGGGCGIRPFLDIWILNHRVESDRQKREALLEKGGLLTFASSMENVSEVWFSEAHSDALSAQVSDYVVGTGIYGATKKAEFQQAQKGGRLRYLIGQRLFMPYVFLKVRYPVLQKHKWLTPVYQVVRWGHMLRDGRLKFAMKELQFNMTTSSNDCESATKLLKQLGL